MNRIYVATVAAAMVAVLAAPAAQAKEPKGHWDRWHGPCSTWEYGERLLTPGQWRADPHGADKIRRLVACVFDRFAPGNTDHALYVADRESSFYPWAQNPYSGCAGLFQHIPSAWPGRASEYLDHWMFEHWPARWWDPRANAIVAAKMVARSGWGPWGG